MFHFKNFALKHENSTLKIGTDSVLLASLIPIDHVTSVLDIGCGCGVISFCIADRLQIQGIGNYAITGIDIDLPSVQEATENAHIFPKATQAHLTFQHTALQHFYPKEHFDLIVSNPPFFSHSLLAQNHQKVIGKHRDNTLPFDDLAQHVSRLLTSTGRFYLILPSNEAEVWLKTTSNLFFLIEKIAIIPIVGKPIHRYILGFSLQKNVPIKESCITIRDSDYTYHESYRQITKIFYLNF